MSSDVVYLALITVVVVLAWWLKGVAGAAIRGHARQPMQHALMIASGCRGSKWWENYLVFGTSIAIWSSIPLPL